MHGRWFWAWVLVGFAAAIGVFVVGVLTIPLLLVVGGAMASRPTIRSSAFGFVTGAGLLVLYVAWVQRAGPGTTCWHHGTASGCDEHLNPLPWLAAGLVLTAAGFVGQARRNG